MADTSWVCTMIPASLPTMTNETIPPVAIKAAQRFPIRLSHPLLRVLFLLFFARRSNCYVKVGEGAIGLIGACSGVVEVALREPRWVRLVFFPVRCRQIAVSAGEPEALIVALQRPAAT